MPLSAPLITGARTGYSHPGCYAAIADDCSSKLSNEHWLSANIIDAAGAGRAVSVSGMPWQEGKQHKLSAKSLGSNVLCEGHNQGLSPLDTLAGEIFRVVHHYQADLLAPVDPHGNEFAFYSGDYLERWMLKLYWGGVAAGTLGRPGARIRSLPLTADLRRLADFLFRDAHLPDGWGLHLAARPGGHF